MDKERNVVAEEGSVVTEVKVSKRVLGILKQLISHATRKKTGQSVDRMLRDLETLSLGDDDDGGLPRSRGESVDSVDQVFGDSEPLHSGLSVERLLRHFGRVTVCDSEDSGDGRSVASRDPTKSEGTESEEAESDDDNNDLCSRTPSRRYHPRRVDDSPYALEKEKKKALTNTLAQLKAHSAVLNHTASHRLHSGGACTYAAIGPSPGAQNHNIQFLPQRGASEVHSQNVSCSSQLSAESWNILEDVTTMYVEELNRDDLEILKSVAQNLYINLECNELPQPVEEINLFQDGLAGYISHATSMDAEDPSWNDSGMGSGSSSPSSINPPSPPDIHACSPEGTAHTVPRLDPYDPSQTDFDSFYRETSPGQERHDFETLNQIASNPILCDRSLLDEGPASFVCSEDLSDYADSLLGDEAPSPGLVHDSPPRGLSQTWPVVNATQEQPRHSPPKYIPVVNATSEQSHHSPPQYVPATLEQPHHSPPQYVPATLELPHHSPPQYVPATPELPRHSPPQYIPAAPQLGVLYPVTPAIRHPPPAVSGPIPIMPKVERRAASLSGRERLLKKMDKGRRMLAWSQVAIKHDMLTECDEEGDTQLMVLCVKFRKEVGAYELEYVYALVERLKEIPRALSAVNKQHESALHMAALHTDSPDRALIVRYIADTMAERGEPLEQPSPCGNSMLHRLCRLGDERHDVIDELLAVRDSFWKPSFDVNAFNSEGKTPLHLAASHHPAAGASCDKTVQLLVAGGARVLMRDAVGGNTALHLAIMNSCSPGLVQALLSAARTHGAEGDLKQICNVKNQSGDTPLHLAASRNDLSVDQQRTVVRMLMEHKAGKSMNAQGKYPIVLVAEERRQAIRLVYDRY